MDEVVDGDEMLSCICVSGYHIGEMHCCEADRHNLHDGLTVSGKILSLELLLDIEGHICNELKSEVIQDCSCPVSLSIT